MSEWCDDHEKLCAFGRVLYAAGSLLSTEDVFYYFEKPWKWDDEHIIWEGCGSPSDPTDPAWEWFYRKLGQESE